MVKFLKILLEGRRLQGWDLQVAGLPLVREAWQIGQSLESWCLQPVAAQDLGGHNSLTVYDMQKDRSFLTPNGVCGLSGVITVSE